MDNNALLYYFSTLAQCLAALAALPAVFVHFRTQTLVRLMVGLGKSMLLRWDREPDYVQRYVPTLDKRRLLERLRLEAAVEREDLRIVHDLLTRFDGVEANLFKEGRTNGFASARKHFESLNQLRNELRKNLVASVVCALLGLSVALVGIICISRNATCWVPMLILVSAAFGIVTMILVAQLVYSGMKNLPEQELKS